MCVFDVLLVHTRLTVHVIALLWWVCVAHAAQEPFTQPTLSSEGDHGNASADLLDSNDIIQTHMQVNSTTSAAASPEKEVLVALRDVLESANEVRKMVSKVECPTEAAFTPPFGSAISMGQLCQVWTDCLHCSRQNPEDVSLDFPFRPSPFFSPLTRHLIFELFFARRFLN